MHIDIRMVRTDGPQKLQTKKQITIEAGMYGNSGFRMVRRGAQRRRNKRNGGEGEGGGGGGGAGARARGIPAGFTKDFGISEKNQN